MVALAFFGLFSGLGQRLARWLERSSPRSLEEGLIPLLFVRRLEDRRVLNAHASPFSVVAGTLVVSAGHSANGSDTFFVSRQGNEVDIAVDGKQAVAASLQNVDAIRLVGSGDQDRFVIDFSGGDPIPRGGIEVIGGNRSRVPTITRIAIRFGGIPARCPRGREPRGGHRLDPTPIRRPSGFIRHDLLCPCRPNR